MFARCLLGSPTDDSARTRSASPSAPCSAALTPSSPASAGSAARLPLTSRHRPSPASSEVSRWVGAAPRSEPGARRPPRVGPFDWAGLRGRRQRTPVPVLMVAVVARYRSCAGRWGRCWLRTAPRRRSHRLASGRRIAAWTLRGFRDQFGLSPDARSWPGTADCPKYGRIRTGPAVVIVPGRPRDLVLDSCYPLAALLLSCNCYGQRT
jgi:hypothetical protein